MVVIFLRWHLFFSFAFFSFLFYSSAWDKCQFGGLYFVLFLHNGLAYKWLFWFVFCTFSVRFCFPVSPVFSPRLTIIITIVIIVTPNSGARTTRYMTTSVSCWAASGILDQVSFGSDYNLFFFFLFSIVVCTRVYFLCSLRGS